MQQRPPLPAALRQPHQGPAASPDSLDTRRSIVLSSAAEASTTAALSSLAAFSFVAECDLPTARGSFRLRGYRHNGDEPSVVVKGDVRGENVLVRVHDQARYVSFFLLS